MTTKKILSEKGYDKLGDLPFRIKMSFSQVFDYWEEKASDPNSSENARAKHILKTVGADHPLRSAFDDISIIEKYKDEVRLLLSNLFPEILSDNEIKAISLPFLPMFFNPSKRFQKILDGAGDNYDFLVRDFDIDQIYKIAGSFMLSWRYGVQQRYKTPIFYDIPDKEKGTKRHYRAFFNGDFSVFKENENSVDLTPEDIQELINNFEDIEMWKRKIPPQSFDFEGFAVVTLFDVTADQALSGLKDKLLRKDVLHSASSIAELAENVRSYMDLDDIHVGLASYDHESKRIRSLGGESWSAKLMHNLPEIERRECFCDFSIDQLFKHKKKLILPNMDEIDPSESPLTQSLANEGVKSAILAPLDYGEEVLGFLELTSSSPEMLNAIVAEKLDSLLPLFTVAVKRAQDEQETRLEAIVQEKFTSIHSSVSWKFFKAAEKVLNARRAGIAIEPDDIVFHDVIPLFGQFDIRGSSSERNLSIQSDLVEQLTLAEEVVSTAMEVQNLPFYRLLRHRINHFSDRLKNEINAGDEVKILDFLNREVYPVFSHIEQENEQLRKAVQNYKTEIDPELNVIYKKRKAYEDTVTMINERISDYIETQQEIAQKMFPHYFEKYKTDGVEFNIYIGASLLQVRDYHPMYLQNLRIWQLLVTCGVENLIYNASKDFPTKLEIASLILAHNNPLSIKFRMDEKQFDVDGAYNIRYEIMKKRIDKAYIKGTKERLTQPGFISIVYSQEEEAEEYKRYIEYLQSNGYLSDGVEDLELEDLQGTTGLKALRVQVVYDQGEEDAIKELLQTTMVPQ
jgi:molybdopterin converting factor small subunit